jgi:xylulokinase
MYRAVMEGIAYEYSLYLKILKELLGDVGVKQVFAIGGGARSAIFNQIKADALGIPYVTLKNADTATLGSAVIAGYGVGLFSDIASFVDGLVQKDEIIEPNSKNHVKYSSYSDIYDGLFGSLENTFLKLIKAGSAE